MRRATLLTLLLALSLVVPASASAAQLLGAQSHALWSSVSTDQRDHELDLLHDAGANSVRLDLGWGTLQPSGPQSDSGAVARVDSFMAAARARGLKVVLTLWGSPCWASSAPADQKLDCSGQWWDRDVVRYPPNDAAAYAAAAAFSAQRWAADLAALEVWNEPDDNYFWASDPAAYARLLKATYPAVKAAAPSVPVLGASLSGADGPWLKGIYAAGGGGNFDALAVHLYTGANDPALPAPTVDIRWSLLSGLDLMRSIMGSNGDSGKGIWVTEMGYSTCGSTSPVCVSETTQANYLATALSLLAAQSDVREVSIYKIRDTGDDTNGRYGLLGADFRQKPAYTAVKAAFTGTAPAASTATGTTSGATSGTTSGTTSGSTSGATTGTTSGTTTITPGTTSPRKPKSGAHTRLRLRLRLRTRSTWVLVRGFGAPAHARVRVRVIMGLARVARFATVRADRHGRFRIVVRARPHTRVRILARVV